MFQKFTEGSVLKFLRINTKGFWLGKLIILPVRLEAKIIKYAVLCNLGDFLQFALYVDYLGAGLSSLSQLYLCYLLNIL